MLAADLIATGGTVRTVDEQGTVATAFAVRSGAFVAVGCDADIERFAGPDTVRIALAGRTALPGFCDAHIHLAWTGIQYRHQADLVGCESIDEILSRLADHAVDYDGAWIQGHGFEQDRLAERRFPTRQELDRLSDTRPIIVSRICTHAAVVNSAALALLTDEERAAGNAESGVYTEEAIDAFDRRIPPLSPDEEEQAVLLAARSVLKTGITSVGTLLDTPDQMGIYARLRRKGKLPLRVTGMPPYASIDGLYQRGVNTTFGDASLKFGGAKFFSDGSLGARTALLSAPYADFAEPATTDGCYGVRIYDPEDLKRKAATAQAQGFQIVIHAIGDQAVRESLDAILYALGPDGDNRVHRHRIEHASLLPPDLLAQMAKRKIVAVVQPQFVTTDTWTGDRVGPVRRHWAFPFREMSEAGIPLALSSDSPIEKPDAFACLASAVFRHPWSPDGGLSMEAALRAYCWGGQYALHQENLLGSIEVGKRADFVILPADPVGLGEASLRALTVDAVYIDGQPVLSV